MRLICPNCGAQYEVADDVIPSAGRDVQCSNCGHTWFETPGQSEAEEVGDPPPVQTPQVEEDAPTEAEPAPEPEAEPKPEPESAPEPDPAPQRPKDRPESTDPRRRELSPEIARILREEAEREEAQRRAEAGALESQPDLGLDAPIDREEQLAEEARRRMARMRGEAAPAIGAAVTAESGTRKELLPDIEEINSSLRSEAEREALPRASEPAPEAQSRKGFRYGFSLMLAIAAVLLLLYVFAPQIADRVPALSAPLETYVQTADRWRIWLDTEVQALIARFGGDAARAE